MPTFEIWIDAPLAPWIEETFGIAAKSVRWLGLRDARDREIFEAARQAGAIVMTKDADFVRLQALHRTPPRVLWLTFGNTTYARVREVLTQTLPAALELLASGEVLVEITERQPS